MKNNIGSNASTPFPFIYPFIRLDIISQSCRSLRRFCKLIRTIRFTSFRTDDNSDMDYQPFDGRFGFCNNAVEVKFIPYILGHLGFSITRYSNAAEILRKLFANTTCYTVGVISVCCKDA